MHERVLRWRRNLLEVGRRPTAPHHLVVLLLIVGGVALRVHALGFPSGLLFDEHHFVENARNYLGGRADWNDHPPLGKLFIAASIALLGDRALAWRLPALLLGLLTLVFAGVAVRRLFRSREAGWIAAALLAADGFLISYSRVGLLDGYLACCAAATLLVASLPWTVPTTLAAGLLAGVAASIKFSGVTVLLPFGVALLTANRTEGGRGGGRLGKLALMLATAAVAYVALFAFGLHLAKQPSSPLHVVAETRHLLEHHAGLTDMKNPWTSGWPAWAIPTRPMTVGYIDRGAVVLALTSLGNLAVWWAAVAVGLVVTGAFAWLGLAATLYPPALPPATGWRWSDFIFEHGRAALIAISTAIGFLAPWVATHRDSYIYHFLPSYTALVALLGGALGWMLPKRRTTVLVFLLVVLLVAAFYAPLWSFLPLSPAGLERRLFLKSWR